MNTISKDIKDIISTMGYYRKMYMDYLEENLKVIVSVIIIFVWSWIATLIFGFFGVMQVPEVPRVLFTLLIWAYGTLLIYRYLIRIKMLEKPN